MRVFFSVIIWWLITKFCKLLSINGYLCQTGDNYMFFLCNRPSNKNMLIKILFKRWNLAESYFMSRRILCTGLNKDSQFAQNKKKSSTNLKEFFLSIFDLLGIDMQHWSYIYIQCFEIFALDVSIHNTFLNIGTQPTPDITNNDNLTAK